MRRLLYLALAIPFACGDNAGPSGPTADYGLPTDGSTPPRIAEIPFPSNVFAAADGGFAISVESLPFGDGADGEALANLSVDVRPIAQRPSTLR